MDDSGKTPLVDVSTVNRVAGQISRVVHDELEAKTRPLDLLTAIQLSLLGLASSLPEKRPYPLTVALAGVEACLISMGLDFGPKTSAGPAKVAE